MSQATQQSKTILNPVTLRRVIMKILAQILTDFKGILMSLEVPKSTVPCSVLCAIENDLMGSSRTKQTIGLQKLKTEKDKPVKKIPSQISV